MAGNYIFEVCTKDQLESGYESNLCDSTYFNTNYNFFDYTRETDEYQVKNAIQEFIDSIESHIKINENEDSMPYSFELNDEGARNYFRKTYEEFVKNVSELSLDKFAGNADSEGPSLWKITQELTDTFEAPYIYYEGDTRDFDSFIRNYRGEFFIVNALSYHC